MAKPTNATNNHPGAEAQRAIAVLAERLGCSEADVVKTAVLKLAAAELGEAADVPEPLKSRLLCVRLIEALDDRGLPEAVESLTEMVRFYEEPPPPYRDLPEGESIPAQWGEKVVRPVFPVTEEE